MFKWIALLIPLGSCNLESVFSYEKLKNIVVRYKDMKQVEHHSKIEKQAILHLKPFIKHTYNITHPHTDTTDNSSSAYYFCKQE